jgi:hypothetical protein
VVVAASHRPRAPAGGRRSSALSALGRSRSPPGELGFGLLELAQALLPLTLEAARDEAVLGIDSATAAFGTLCLVPGTLGGELPLGERILAIGFEPFGGGESGFKTSWSKPGEDGACNRAVDLHCAHAQTVDATTIDDIFAGAVVAFLWEELAPKTVAALIETMQIEAPLLHCKWSGRACFSSVAIPKLGALESPVTSSIRAS